jgi:YVTN family beta-propeller protein
MGSLSVVETIANVASGTCAVGATMDMNYGHKGHVYVASNTQAGRVTVIDVGTNSVIGVFSVGVRPLGIGVRMWPTKM